MSKYDMNYYLMNSFANRAMKSPSFAIGELLGRAWSNNYLNRGTNKAIKDYENQYSEAANEDERMRALAMLEAQNKQQGAYKTLGDEGNGSFSSPINASNQIAKDLAVDTVRGRAINSVSVNRPENFQDKNSEFNIMQLQNIANNNEKINALKKIGAIPNTTDEISSQALNNYAGSLNYDNGNFVSNPSVDAIAQGYATERIKNFDAKKALASIKLDLTKRGMTSGQREEILGAMTDKLQAMQDSINKGKSQSIIKELAEIAPDSSVYQSKVAELAKVNPEAANLFMKNIVNGRDIWGNEKKIDGMEKQFYLQQQGADNQFSRTKQMTDYSLQAKRNAANQQFEDQIGIVGQAIGTTDRNAILQYMFKNGMLSGGNVKATGTKGNVNDETQKKYKLAVDLIKREDEAAINSLDYKNYKYSDSYKLAKAFAGAYEKNAFSFDNEKQKLNFNNYDEAIPYFSKIVKSGKYSTSQIVSAIRQNYGLKANDNSNEFVEKILDDLGLQSNSFDVEDSSSGVTSEAENQAALKKQQEEYRKKLQSAEYVNPYTGTPYSYNPWLSNPNDKSR
ncbi:MAG: hypothetical protein RSA27_05380 [Oscillospiraceae bacterium]